jgi:hypothetical protein
MNKEWHAKNKMPERATLQERIEWHVRHQRFCACRAMPKSLLKYVAAKKADRATL